MIAPSRKQRAEMGPAGYKESMRPREGLDMEDMDDGGADESSESGDYTITVPAHCLAGQDGDGGDLNPGDTVDFDAEAEIVSAEDDKVTIKIKSINGEACDGSSDHGEGGSDENYSGGGGMGGNTNQESTAAMGSRLRSKLPQY